MHLKPVPDLPGTDRVAADPLSQLRRSCGPFNERESGPTHRIPFACLSCQQSHTTYFKLELTIFFKLYSILKSRHFTSVTQLSDIALKTLTNITQQVIVRVCFLSVCLLPALFDFMDTVNSSTGLSPYNLTGAQDIW